MTTPSFTAVAPGSARDTFVFPLESLPLAEKALEKVNRRLERLGLSQRFTYTTEFFKRQEEGALGGVMPMVRLKLSVPSLSFQGYTFVAAVALTPAGELLVNTPGRREFVPEVASMKCEACGKVMKRQKTYILQDKDGALLQVGSSCVKNFFGVRPQGLWALEYDFEEVTADFPSAPTNSLELPSEVVLALALVLSQGGEKFISQSYAQKSGDESTASATRRVVLGNVYRGQYQEEVAALEAYLPEARQRLEVLRSLEPNSSYLRNLKSVVTGDTVRVDQLGIFVSFLATPPVKPEPPTIYKGFRGEVGDSLKGVTLEVLSSTVSESYDYMGYPTVTSRVRFLDEEGHLLLWWASRDCNFEKGR